MTWSANLNPSRLLAYPLVALVASAATFLVAGRPASDGACAPQESPQTPQHEALMQLEGRWRGEQTIYGVKEGSEPVTYRVEERLTPACGDLWLLGRFEGTGDFRGLSITGFNPTSGRYELVWVSSVSPRLTIMVGEENEQGTMRTYHGKMPDREGNMRNARIVELLTGEKTRTFELSFEKKGGGWLKAMSINYRRR